MKTLSHTLYIFVLLLLNACASHTEIKKLDNSGIDAATLTNEVQRLVEQAQVHGLALAVFSEHQLVYKNTFGYGRFDTKTPLTDSTNLYGASLSKAVFGVLVMQLVEEGVIDLDTPLQHYLPRKIWEYEPRTRWHDDYAALTSDSLYHKITARMCLSHTSGFPNWRWFEADQKLKVLDTPGTRYRYSGEGMTYLQVVLERMLKKDLEELAQEKIFQPLGMHNTSYTWQPQFEDDFAYGHAATGALLGKDKDNEARGASTLETTLEDYSKFMEAVLQQKLLSPASYRELFATQIRIHSLRQFGPLSLKDSTLNDAIALGYGLGWGVLQSPYGVGAFKEGGGSGFHHYSIIYPEAGIGVLIMTNSDNGTGIFKELLALTIADTYSPTEWNNYVPYQEKAPIADSLYGYQCSPCNQACDSLTFTDPGKCPHCQMGLVPKISLVRGE
ncbi:XRE family transcriptional regulator [Flammeovirgaceae bacterium 311]|nr:XRE family transcriptional regulator [Flammeovirgaceae bacterium 311]